MKTSQLRKLIREVLQEATYNVRKKNSSVPPKKPDEQKVDEGEKTPNIRHAIKPMPLPGVDNCDVCGKETKVWDAGDELMSGNKLRTIKLCKHCFKDYEDSDISGEKYERELDEGEKTNTLGRGKCDVCKTDALLYDAGDKPDNTGIIKLCKSCLKDHEGEKHGDIDESAETSTLDKFKLEVQKLAKEYSSKKITLDDFDKQLVAIRKKHGKIDESIGFNDAYNNFENAQECEYWKRHGETEENRGDPCGECEKCYDVSTGVENY